MNLAHNSIGLIGIECLTVMKITEIIIIDSISLTTDFQCQISL